MPLPTATNRYRSLLPPNMGTPGGSLFTPQPSATGGTAPSAGGTKPPVSGGSTWANPYASVLKKPGSEPLNPLGGGPNIFAPVNAFNRTSAQPWIPPSNQPAVNGTVPAQNSAGSLNQVQEAAQHYNPTLPAAPAPSTQVATPMPFAGGFTYNDPGPANNVDVAAPMPNTQPAASVYDPEPYKVSNEVGKVGDVASFDKGPLTDLGKQYRDALTRDLTSPDNPYLKSIWGNIDRQTTRNSYGANRDAEEALGQAGITAGTSQYNRALAKASAGANSANLDLVNGGASQARGFYANALKGAGDYENTMYDRASTEQKTALDRAKYGDDRSDLQHTTDETGRLEKKGDVLAWINSIQDPKAQAAARNAFNAGQDPRTLSGQIFDQYGAVQGNYKSASPGEVEYQGIRDRVANAFKGQTNPKTGQPYTPAELDALAGQYAQQGLENEYRPITEGTKAAEKNTTLEKLRAGEKLTPAEEAAAIKSGAIPEYTAASLPRTGVGTADLIGKPVNIGGKVYTVVKSDTTRTGAETFSVNYRHTDWTQVRDQNGKDWYVYNGTLNEAPPKKIKSGWAF